jgi:hypothetical protein
MSSCTCGSSCGTPIPILPCCDCRTRNGVTGGYVNVGIDTPYGLDCTDCVPPCYSGRVVPNTANNTDKPKPFNLSYSSNQMIRQKRVIVTTRIDGIKNLAYWPITPRYALYFEGQQVQLFQPIKESETNLFTFKIRNWKISEGEKQNLYFNLLAQAEEINNLNMFYQVKNRLTQCGLGNLDSYVINNYINRNLSYIISRILIYGEYGQELENYNYSQLFNLLFNYISLNLNYIRTFLWVFISIIISRSYGIDPKKVKQNQNPEITNSEKSQEKRKCSNCN